MKFITPFTILNQNFQNIDLITEAMNNRRLVTENCMKNIEKCIKAINLLIST